MPEDLLCFCFFTFRSEAAIVRSDPGEGEREKNSLARISIAASPLTEGFFFVVYSEDAIGTQGKASANKKNVF